MRRARVYREAPGLWIIAYGEPRPRDLRWRWHSEVETWAQAIRFALWWVGE